ELRMLDRLRRSDSAEVVSRSEEPGPGRLVAAERFARRLQPPVKRLGHFRAEGRDDIRPARVRRHESDHHPARHAGEPDSGARVNDLQIIPGVWMMESLRAPCTSFATATATPSKPPRMSASRNR